jgi:toxin YoeB
MKIIWAPNAQRDYFYWAKTNHKVSAAIDDLIADIKRDPFRGLGKPEPLKFQWRGWWSRRITGEHRLVYRVTGKRKSRVLEIAQCRYHYR